MIFAPDDFRGNPYVAGLNQIGHVVFGAVWVDCCCTVVRGVGDVSDPLCGRAEA